MKTVKIDPKYGDERVNDRHTFQPRFLKNKGLKPEHYFLEIGCAMCESGVYSIEYLNQGHYFGVDVLKERVEVARERIRDEELEDKQPTIFHHEDINNLNIDQRFDFIASFSVLYHMEERILRDCFQKVHSLLNDNGVFYANVHNEDHPRANKSKQGQLHWGKFPIYFPPVQFYIETAADCGLVAKDIGSLKNLGLTMNRPGYQQQRMLEVRKK